MRRFFIDAKAIEGKTVFIGGDELHHIRDVIRLMPGDRFLGFDGSGRTYTLRIDKISDRLQAKIEKVSTRRTEPAALLLACALPKKKKMDTIIEKATELGVSDIVPMVTERTQVKLDDKRAVSKQKKWRAIAIEAAKQSGRDTLPEIHKPMSLRQAIELIEKLGYDKRIMPALCEGAVSLTDALSDKRDKVAVFIGPEGDFTAKEIGSAKSSGFDIVTLGPLVLKVDTACIFAISVIQALLSEQSV